MCVCAFEVFAECGRQFGGEQTGFANGIYFKNIFPWKWLKRVGNTVLVSQRNKILFRNMHVEIADPMTFYITMAKSWLQIILHGLLSYRHNNINLMPDFRVGAKYNPVKTIAFSSWICFDFNKIFWTLVHSVNCFRSKQTRKKHNSVRSLFFLTHASDSVICTRGKLCVRELNKRHAPMDLHFQSKTPSLRFPLSKLFVLIHILS